MDFTPDLTPQEAIELGVLAEQYPHSQSNYFGVSASTKTWPQKWLPENAPQGWFEWWINYSNGARGPDDEKQIARWKSFKARHLAQLQKADPTLSDLSIQPKRRQALLNWGIEPSGKLKKRLELIKKAVSLLDP